MSDSVKVKVYYSERVMYEETFKVPKNIYNQIIDKMTKNYNENLSGAQTYWTLQDYITNFLPNELQNYGFELGFDEGNVVDSDFDHSEVFMVEDE